MLVLLPLLLLLLQMFVCLFASNARVSMGNSSHSSQTQIRNKPLHYPLEWATIVFFHISFFFICLFYFLFSNSTCVLICNKRFLFFTRTLYRFPPFASECTCSSSSSVLQAAQHYCLFVVIKYYCCCFCSLRGFSKLSLCWRAHDAALNCRIVFLLGCFFLSSLGWTRRVLH